jgi:hypothetical protein
LALGTTAPEGSVTVPEIEDVMFCPIAGLWTRQRMNAIKRVDADVMKFLMLLREACDLGDSELFTSW